MTDRATQTDDAVEAEEFPRITDEALSELRERIGVEVVGPDPYVTEANGDAIRHWADGIGDRNPLWRDEEHAKNSRWGGIVAPPTILYAFDRICSGYVGGMPGIHAMFAGTDFRWKRPIRLGDKISAVARLQDLIERESAFSEKAVQQIYRVEFRDADGELVCEADSWCFRTQRSVARDRVNYDKVEDAAWTSDQIDEIAAQYAAEEFRGAEPRYFEDVNEGDVLPTILKGPLTVTSVVAFDQGWGGLYIRAHGVAYDMFAKHPALAIPNLQGAPEPPERVHWDDDLARRVGVPGAYDYGPERVSWLGQVMTNWIGDDAMLRRLNVQVRHHNILGDLTRCSGRVTGKWVDDDQHVVEVELECVDQRGVRTAVGKAEAVLPSRSEN